VDCELEVQGHCEAECDKPEGALFCDGQYIDHEGKLENCVAALREKFDIEVDGYSSGSSSCSEGSCEAEGKAGGSVNCAVVDPGRAQRKPWAWLLVALAPLAIGLRRRAQSE